MNILLKQALIINKGAGYHNQTKDILIENGTIKTISDTIAAQNDCIVVDAEGLTVTTGWTDLFADFSDPGYEFKETIASGCAAAAAGGFTQVGILPNTAPTVSTKSQVEYITNKAFGEAVTLLPLGAVTKNIEGNTLAEMYDMNASGAAAFTDGWSSIQSSGVLLKALQYVKAIDKTIIQLPIDKSISAHGLMHEGIVSTQLGLPGIPAIGEELIIARDIELLGYTQSKLHITGVSTKKGLQQISEAKQKGLNITCSVTPHHLLYCDEDLAEYDSNLKVSPPLRSRADMLYLREAVAGGLVDCIATHHRAQDWDNKTCEFEYAKNGIAGIQTAFNAVLKAIPTLSNEQIESLFSTNAKAILGLNKILVEEGALANFTLFSTKGETQITKANFKSKSVNNRLIGETLPGKVFGIINKGKLILN